MIIIDVILKIFQESGFAGIFADPRYLIMILIACFLLIEYASAYDDSAANYCSTEGCYVGYLEDAYWCEFLDETNETILSIIYTPGSNAEAALSSSHGLSNALSLQASLMADTLTTYREVTISEMSDAFNEILEMLSDE